MTSEELKKLRELADAATSGPWIRRDTSVSSFITTQPRRANHVLDIATVGYTCTYEDEPTEFMTAQRANAAFIAAANPQTVLKLLDEIERLGTFIDGYKTANEEAQEVLNELEQEAQWLAEQLPKQWVIAGKAKTRCIWDAARWREMARATVAAPTEEVKEETKPAGPKWA